MIPAVSANQKRDRAVRMRPLSGTAVGSTTSNALMRSLATRTIRPSGSSNRSRTLPERRNQSVASTGSLRGRQGSGIRRSGIGLAGPFLPSGAGRARRGRGWRYQGVQPGDHLVDVTQEDGLVEARIEVRQRQLLGDGRVDGDQLAQRD